MDNSEYNTLRFEKACFANDIESRRGGRKRFAMSLA
jgi:hypothetical protein